MATKKKHKKKKSLLKSRFYRIYFLALIAVSIAIVIGCIVLNGIIKDYETALPDHVAEDAVKLYENRDFETLYTLDSAKENIAEGDHDFYIENMKELTEGKEVSLRPGFTSEKDEKLFTVYMDSDRFAEIRLVPSGETTSHGNRFWKLDSVRSFVTAEKPVEELPPEEEAPVEEIPQEELIECKITVENDCTVTVDGEKLKVSDIRNGDVPVFDPKMLPDGVPIPKMNEYVIYHKTGDPQIEVTDKSGASVELTKDGDYSWTCAIPENPEIKKSVESGVVRTAKQMAGYSTKDVKQSAMLPFCASGSPAVKSVKNFDNNWCTRHISAKFENMETSQYRLYGDDCFSVHVTFDYNVHFGKNNDKVYPTAYTYVFVKQKGKYKLYSFTLY